MLEVYRDWETLSTGKLKYQIAGGMDRLPRCFLGDRPALPSWIQDNLGEYAKERRIADPNTQLPNLSKEIRFHARVFEVSKEGGKFHIRYENTFTHSEFCGDPDGYDHLVLAAPFSALSHVNMGDKVLSPQRMQAIRNLHYENATKIILEFSEQFWETNNDIKGGRSFTDLPIRWVYYPPRQQWAPRGRGLLLASYTWGEDSLRWGSLKPYDRIYFALRNIAELHGLDVKVCGKLLVGGLSHSWAEDEYTFGAFAIFNPHQENDLFADIWKPNGQGVHFAGEHASYRHAWIEGAVESGIRVAMEIEN